MQAENKAAAATMADEELKESQFDSDDEFDGKRRNIYNTQATVLDAKALQLGRSQTMALFDAKANSGAVKKSNTILSPHLEILASGSMIIEFDNMDTAH